MQATCFKCIEIAQKQDLELVNEALRSIYNTAEGVPCSVELSASYATFRVKCLQLLSRSNSRKSQNENKFSISLDNDVTLRYLDGCVYICKSISAPVLRKRQHEDEDNYTSKKHNTDVTDLVD